MKATRVVLVILSVALFGVGYGYAEGPVVSNVRVTPRTDESGMVDIYYDLYHPHSLASTVTLRLSKDGGATYPFAMSSVTGDLGADVAPGANRHVVWDAQSDYPGERIGRASIQVEAMVMEEGEGEAELYQFRVSDNTGRSENPALAVAPDGTASVVWEDDRDGNWEIYFRRVNAAGTPLTPEIRVSNGTATSLNADVDADGNGFSYVVWQEGQNIAFCVLDPIGNKTVSDKTLSSGSCSYPAIAVGSDGISHVAWEKTVISLFRIYFCRLDAAGNKLGSDVIVSNRDIIGIKPKAPDIALDGSGNSYLVWRDYYNYVAGIYCAEVTPEGTMPINTRITNQDNASFSRINIHGEYLYVVFQDKRTTADQIYAFTGINTDRVLSDSPVSARKPAVAVDPEGAPTYFTAWTDGRDGNDEVYLLEMDAVTGVPVGDAQRVTELGNSSAEVDLRMRSGSCYLVWHDMRDGNTEIYLQKWN